MKIALSLLSATLLITAISVLSFAQSEPGAPPPAAGDQGMPAHRGGPGPGMHDGMPGMPPGMHGGPAMEGAQRMGMFMGILNQMSNAAKDPVTAGIIAIAGLKDDVKRPPEQIIADLENALEHTHALPLRNALRMTLKDLYKQQGQDDKVLKMLHEMLSENDEALSGK